MSPLLDHFERIAVISLPEREDRRSRLVKNLTAHQLATPDDLTWVEGVDGRKSPPPSWWTQGPGAWGCRFSHLNVIQQAHQDKLDSVLILEDDVTFHPRASEWLDTLMPVLPDDWGQFFLGGEFLNKPKPANTPLLLKSNGIGRTHAYAVRGTLFEKLIELIKDDSEYRKNPGWHVDHQYSVHQKNGDWSAYAPTWWLAGQEEGESSIVEGTFRRRWWPLGLDFWKLPFIRLSDSETESPPSLYLAQPPTSPSTLELAQWFRRTAYEAWQQGRIPAFDARSFSQEEVVRVWPAGSHLCHSQDHRISDLADYPANGLFDHPFSRQ
ncbi:MAG: glycosyltransferase family 25 protein [Roseibacillus sp.]